MGPRVERRRFDALEPALDALEARAAELAAAARADPAPPRLRRYGPEHQVAGRLELAGPERRLASVHAGVDVHADGSTAAYLGRLRRRPLAPAANEDAIAALRRALIGH